MNTKIFPDEYGVWVDRAGRVAVTHTHYTVPYVDLYYGEFFGFQAYVDLKHPDLRGEWQKVELPTFPELPPKPEVKHGLVLCRLPGCEPVWREIVDGTVWHPTERFRCVQAYKYTVVPHPENDDYAVQVIEDARKEGQE